MSQNYRRIVEVFLNICPLMRGHFPRLPGVTTRAVRASLLFRYSEAYGEVGQWWYFWQRAFIQQLLIVLSARARVEES